MTPHAKRTVTQHRTVTNQVVGLDRIPKALCDIEQELTEFTRCLSIKHMAEARKQRIWLAFDKAVERIPEFNYTAYDRVTKQSEKIELCAKLEGTQNANEELRMVKLEALDKEAKNAIAMVDRKYDEAKTKARDKPWGKLFEEFCQWKDLQARDESEVALLRVWEERERWQKAVAERKERKRVAVATDGARAQSPPREVKEARIASGVDDSAVSKRVTTESAWLSRKIGERASKVAEVRAAVLGRARTPDGVFVSGVVGEGQGALSAVQTD